MPKTTHDGRGQETKWEIPSRIGVEYNCRRSQMNVQKIKAVNLAAEVAGHSEAFVKLLRNHPKAITGSSRVTDCLRKGYAPKGYGLADFTIVQRSGQFHLFHIPRVPGNSCIDIANEHWLGHAVSADLHTWTTCNPVLSTEPANYFESAHVWAPFVYQEAGRAFMFYTGLTADPSQVLCMAECMDDDMNVWRRSGTNPIIPPGGFDWHWKNEKNNVRHARDPHVVKTGDSYLLAYSAMHRNGCPAIGGMVSNDLRKWKDIGPILYRPMGRAEWMPESVNIQRLPDGRWAMIPSQSPGLEYYISDTPFHWHGLKVRQIRYEDGANDLPAGLEVLLQKKNQWLVAYFEGDRMYAGVLSLDAHPWKLKRIKTRTGLVPWLGETAG